MIKEKECILKEDAIIINAAQVMAIVPENAVTLSEKYRSMTWEEFKEIYEIQTLAGKPEYTFEHIKDAKLILKGMGYSLTDCLINYCKGHPLTIQTEAGWSIAIAPRIVEEE